MNFGGRKTRYEEVKIKLVRDIARGWSPFSVAEARRVQNEILNDEHRGPVLKYMELCRQCELRGILLASEIRSAKEFTS